MKAERLPNGNIRLLGKVWGEEFTEDRLAGWIKWYDQMHKDYGYPRYKEAADALRAVQ